MNMFVTPKSNSPVYRLMCTSRCWRVVRDLLQISHEYFLYTDAVLRHSCFLSSLPIMKHFPVNRKYNNHYRICSNYYRVPTAHTTDEQLVSSVCSHVCFKTTRVRTAETTQCTLKPTA
ncbi:hypothetical protein EB796_006520 [Bugula neritina]|uniref:Uncharacterized protein n=1 Tax=Bugula neritina TaxID=10212 RepID=A0A7J7KAD6_BUGNE|nr:hypothetical protein EB796_006520 [Bugula neritina]